MNNNAFDEEKTIKLLKQLSIEDFLGVGLNQVAYIKKSTDDTEFVIHAADGSEISVMNSYDMAVAAIRVHDLFPVTVH